MSRRAELLANRIEEGSAGLGHASIETTQRYAKLTDEVAMREAQRISGRGDVES